MELEGRTAVVPGAGGGIGGALVGELFGRGARHVVAADLDLDGVDSLREELGAAVSARALDVADEQATLALIDDVEETLAPIDLWFANAGVATGTGPEAPDEQWELQWRVNVMSHVYAARALLPRWLERGEGH